MGDYKLIKGIDQRRKKVPLIFNAEGHLKEEESGAFRLETVEQSILSGDM